MWAQAKAHAMAALDVSLDKSLAGAIDPPIEPLCRYINSLGPIFTTSSCSGRVVLFWQQEQTDETPEMLGDVSGSLGIPPVAGDGSALAARKAGGGRWLYITHGVPSLDQMMAFAEPLPSKGLVVLKMEPFLLHARCASLGVAALLQRLAMGCGMRESGVTLSTPFPLVAMRSTAMKLDTVVAAEGQWLVGRQYMEFAIELATKKMQLNWERLAKLESELRLRLPMDLPPLISAIKNGTCRMVDTVIKEPTPDSLGESSEQDAGGNGALVMEAALVKTVKTCLEQATKQAERGLHAEWIDLGAQIGAASSGNGALPEICTTADNMAIPLTAHGAKCFAALVADGTAGDVEPAHLSAPLNTLRQLSIDGRLSLASTLCMPRRVGRHRRAADATPQIRMREGITALLAECPQAEGDWDWVAELPAKWEKIGDVALLPPSACFDARWATFGGGGGGEAWRVICAAIGGGTRRLARQAVVDSGVMRQSRAKMLWQGDGEGGNLLCEHFPILTQCHPLSKKRSRPCSRDDQGGCGWVVHREHKIQYHFDITKVMFSSGNGTERGRIGKLDAVHEVVLDLYAGIGYFTLPLLVHAKVAHVHACELNPDSVAALRRGLAANGVADRCTIYQGDNQESAPALAGDLCDKLPSLTASPSQEPSVPWKIPSNNY